MHSFTKQGALLLTLLAAVQSVSLSGETSCPPSSDIIPCECSDHDGILIHCFGKNSSAEELKSALRGLSDKRGITLQLYGYNLRTVPSNTFSGFDIKKIVFSSCLIDEFENEAFDGLEHSLEELVIQSSISEQGISDFTLNLGHLKNLNALIVTSNLHGIYLDQKQLSLGDDWFANGPTSLRTVKFESNRIKSIGDRVFSNLPNLRDIHLNRNEIEKVRRSMFPRPATHLVSINLGYNTLHELPKDFFDEMPVLEKVSLMKSGIGTLDQATWEPVWERLEELKFGEIACDSSIEWVFEKRRPKELNGVCNVHSDPDKRNKHLYKLIDQKQGRTV